MDAREIKQVADECEQISDFIRRFDSASRISSTIALADAGSTNIRSRISVGLTEELWPEFRKQLVAKYNELAATINADKFFDPKSDE